MTIDLSVFTWIWLAAVGLCVGSLLNVIIYRLPVMISCGENNGYSLWYPRSCCPLCGEKIAWFDNIPVFSWLLLKRRCRYCNGKISFIYPLIEVCAMCIALLGAAILPFGMPLIGALVLGWGLLALAVTDIKHRLLPDLITLSLLWAGLVFHVIVNDNQLATFIIGAVSGYLSLWMLYHLFYFFTRREALGYGDFKLLAALGAWLGWPALPHLLLMASLGGIYLFFICCYVFKRPLNLQLPFGPPLAIAGWGAFLYQNF
jgi:general secretion pathway protein O/leader peptidase (prepilin peptidase)/N-methyltransferase